MLRDMRQPWYGVRRRLVSLVLETSVFGQFPVANPSVCYGIHGGVNESLEKRDLTN